MEIIVSKSNIKIIDSYRIKHKKDMITILDEIKSNSPDCQVFLRNQRRLLSEWKSHSILYSLGICRRRTKDVDLDYPPNRILDVLYFLISLLDLR